MKEISKTAIRRGIYATVTEAVPSGTHVKDYRTDAGSWWHPSKPKDYLRILRAMRNQIEAKGGA